MLEYIICNQLNDDIRYIRETVFIKEQGFENEFDEIDSVAIHMLVKKDNKAIATARLYLENNSYHIGRIAVLKEYRTLKIGSKIIKILEEEVKKSNIVDTVIKVVEKECICPNIENDGCLNNEITDNITNKEESSLVNINTASIEELQTLSGIGESKAKKIIEYREKNGKFKNIEDIKNVEGIGESLYETIKIHITT